MTKARQIRIPLRRWPSARHPPPGMPGLAASSSGGLNHWNSHSPVRAQPQRRSGPSWLDIGQECPPFLPLQRSSRRMPKGWSNPRSSMLTVSPPA